MKSRTKKKSVEPIFFVVNEFLLLVLNEIPLDFFCLEIHLFSPKWVACLWNPWFYSFHVQLSAKINSRPDKIKEKEREREREKKIPQGTRIKKKGKRGKGNQEVKDGIWANKERHSTKKSDTLRETAMLFDQPQEASSRTVKGQPTKGGYGKLVKKERSGMAEEGKVGGDAFWSSGDRVSRHEGRSWRMASR